MASPTIRYDLNSLVSTYNIDNDYEQYKRIEFLEKLSTCVELKDSMILELGSATGAMTAILSDVAKHVTAVDGSSEFIAIAKTRIKGANNVTFVESYFETMSLTEKYDCVILYHILEHLEDPKHILSMLGQYLKPNGILAVLVPNAQALSRQLAVAMGLLGSVYDLTDNDRNHGHHRVYDWAMLENLIRECGYSVVRKHGLSFKLFSDSQNMKMLKADIIGEEQIRGLWIIGDNLPEYAGAMMILAESAL